MFRAFKLMIRNIFKFLGYELIKLSQSSSHNHLGLASHPIGTIVDVGANRGQFAQEFTKIFPSAQVHSFEPLPEPYAALRKWADSKGDHIYTYNHALGDKIETIMINHHIDHDVSSSFLKRTEIGLANYPVMERTNELSVKVKRLDDVFTERPGKKNEEILLKVDVQGYEEKVLNGGSVFLKFCDVVILEISMDQLYSGQAGFQQLCNKMDENNFAYEGSLGQYYADDGHVIFIDALFRRKKT